MRILSVAAVFLAAVLGTLVHNTESHAQRRGGGQQAIVSGGGSTIVQQSSRGGLLGLRRQEQTIISSGGGFGAQNIVANQGGGRRGGGQQAIISGGGGSANIVAQNGRNQQAIIAGGGGGGANIVANGRQTIIANRGYNQQAIVAQNGYGQQAIVANNHYHPAYVQSQLLVKERLRLNQVNYYGSYPVNTSANIYYSQPSPVYLSAPPIVAAPVVQVEQPAPEPVIIPQQSYYTAPATILAVSTPRCAIVQRSRFLLAYSSGGCY